MAAVVPYWRLSGFYFCYFALLGTWVPYWALYLKSLNFSSEEIGILSALVMATKIVAPNLCYGAFSAVVAFCGVYLRSDFWWLAAVVVTYSFFWNAVLAQFDVLTLSHLAGRYGRYSRIRVWGSIGFIAAVLGVGWWLDHHPIVHLLYLITALLTGIWLASLLVAEKDGAVTNRQKRQALASILRHPAVIAFFYTNRFGLALLIAWGAGAAAILSGIGASFYWDLATGPLLVCTFGVTLILAAILRPLLGIRPGHEIVVASLEQDE